MSSAARIVIIQQPSFMYVPNLICILLLFLRTNTSKATFCQDEWPPCDTTENTVCERRKDCAPLKNCEEVHLNGFRKEMVDLHNELRNKIALGRDTRGGNSEASNMRAISYDSDLEFVAQCHLNRCKFVQDKCRLTKRFSDSVGQNLYQSVTSISNKEGARRGVEENWYGQIVNVTADVIKRFQKEDLKVGHFTQLVWARTSHIGCAMSKSKELTILGCNYGEAGNYLGAPVYNLGEACSECGDLKCNSHYTGLCGEITGLGSGHAKFQQCGLLISLTVMLIFNIL